jgi:polyisoprenoid-binding protein YceI
MCCVTRKENPMTTATMTDITTRTYAIDKAHSETEFQVRHLVTKVRGRFNDFEGAIQADEQDPGRSSVTIAIQAASVDTGQPDRDAHLRSADFFAADQYPTLTFASTAITPLGSDRYQVVGDLTIRGVTRQIAVPVTFLGKATDPWGHQRAGFEAEFTINRKDFGLTWNAALETGGFLVGDDVKISVSFQAIAA